MTAAHAVEKKAIAFFSVFEYTKRNRVARSSLDIEDQAESCAQLFMLRGEGFGDLEECF